MSESQENSSVSTDLQAKVEGLKKVGNEAFIAKDYKKAIDHYTEALAADSKNAVLYSNRSACYAALKQWKLAYEDALLSVSCDSKFLKGYYRLATAQQELGMFDDAETTLKAALQLEPDNEAIHKQIKSLKAKKNALAAAEKQKRNGGKKLDEAQMKEVVELQEQINSYSRDLRTVNLRMAGLQREQRVNSVTANHIQTQDASTPLYRSLGKAYVLTPKSDIESRLEKEIGEITKAQRDLTDRHEYLERRIQSTTQNLQDLIGQRS